MKVCEIEGWTCEILEDGTRRALGEDRHKTEVTLDGSDVVLNDHHHLEAIGLYRVPLAVLAWLTEKPKPRAKKGGRSG